MCVCLYCCDFSSPLSVAWSHCCSLLCNLFSYFFVQVRGRFLETATGEQSDVKIKQSTVPVVHYSEIAPVRDLFRKEKYLLQPMLQDDHVTLNRKVKLSDNLVNFTSEAGVLRDNYYSALVNETEFVNSAIYITENEKNDKSKLNNQTKEHKSID